jgi:hypothetical protein
MIRGDSYNCTLTFSNEQGPIDITGWSVFFTLKKNWLQPDSEAALQKIITQHTNPTQGQTALTLLPADTQQLFPGDYDFDIQAVDTSGNVYTVLRGKFTIEYDVTDSAGTAGTSGTTGLN